MNGANQQQTKTACDRDGVVTLLGRQLLTFGYPPRSANSKYGMFTWSIMQRIPAHDLSAQAQKEGWDCATSFNQNGATDTLVAQQNLCLNPRTEQNLQIQAPRF
jgi:hypothetical protein